MKIETYIVFIADYFGSENYPIQHSLELSADKQIEQILKFNNKITADFEKLLQLEFIEKATSENVCFTTQNSELQDDFKQVFTQKDLLDYFYAVIFLPEYQHSQLEENYPKNKNEFWNLVRLGEKLRVQKNVNQ